MSKLFLKVDKDLFNLGLNPLEILILAQIQEFQNNTGDCHLTDQQFAQMFGVSAKTVSRALTNLEATGYIERKTTTDHSTRKRQLKVVG